MKRSKLLWTISFIAMLILLSFYINVPYYITQPGSAISLEPMVQVEKGYHHETGSLKMTTVRMGPTTLAGYLYAQMDPYTDLVQTSDVHNPAETDEDYAQQQLEIMNASQDTAKIVAFERAGYPVHVLNSGAVVMQMLTGYPAEKVLKIGDVITTVNQTKISTAADLVNALKGKKVNERVLLTFSRNGKKQEATIELKTLPSVAKGASPRAGIGIASPITKRVFSLPKKVNIKSEQIGGPSAGLMFTLEIINQLSKENLTKGYQIAGTGTIDEDGAVGRIGGIKHKVVAADRDGAEIFFAPNDVAPAGEQSNYDEAMGMANQIHTNMRIVPVKTVDDALRYLRNLPAKRS